MQHFNMNFDPLVLTLWLQSFLLYTVRGMKIIMYKPSPGMDFFSMLLFSTDFYLVFVFPRLRIEPPLLSRVHGKCI